MRTLDSREEVILLFNRQVISTDSNYYVLFVVLRDIRERGRDLEQVLTQYTTLVKPAFEEFCLPVNIIFLFVCIISNIS